MCCCDRYESDDNGDSPQLYALPSTAIAIGKEHHVYGGTYKHALNNAEKMQMDGIDNTERRSTPRDLNIQKTFL
jgi:hypothetical protein